MTDNFFLDNEDLQFRLSQLDLSEIVAQSRSAATPTTPATQKRRATMPMPWTTTV